jgi:hypothetical protein
MIYPVVSVGTKPSLVHGVEALTNNIASWSPSLFWDSAWLATEARPLKLTPSPCHLDAAFTTELPTKEGSPRPLHKVIVAAPHQAGGSKTCWWATKTPKGWHTEVQTWGSLKNQYKITTPCSHTLPRASIALHLLIKLVLNLRIWSMSSLVGLENFSRVFVPS